MANDNSELMKFVASDIQKYEGIRMPVKAGILEKALVRRAPMDRLHPNPNDEFCNPEIGPNYSIISSYQQKIRKAQEHDKPLFEEPLMVEKMSPDGYLILNGHHRWAAARNMRLKTVPIAIINPTLEIDIKKMLENSVHDKRVSFDLDEVVFYFGDNESRAEKPLGFPFNRIYKERLRLGVPALFLQLTKNGYDIWVYSSEYYSLDYIQRLFRHYHVTVNGVVTCIRMRRKQSLNKSKSIEKMVSNKYSTTITVDNESVLLTRRQTKEFEQFDLTDTTKEWSTQVMNVFETLGKR